MKEQKVNSLTSLNVNMNDSKRYRLIVFQSNAHLYAQVIHPSTGHIVATASSLDASIRKSKGKKTYRCSSNKMMAEQIGSLLRERLEHKSIGVKDVTFDRRKSQYHGKIKWLVDQVMK